MTEPANHSLPAHPTRLEHLQNLFSRLIPGHKSRDFYDRLIQRHGRLVALSPQNYFTRDPEITRHVFLNPELFIRDFERGYGETSRQFWGESYSLFNGTTWLNKRHLIHQATEPAHIEHYINQAMQIIQAFTQSWELSDEMQELHPQLMRVTLATTAYNIFGFGLDDAQLQVIEEALFATFLWFDNLHLKESNQKSNEEIFFETTMNRLDALVYQLIEQHRQSANNSSHNILTILMNNPAMDGQYLTDKDLRDEIVTLLRAGHRNDGTLVTWCIALLHLHPETYQKLKAEINTVIGNALPQAQHLPDMVYARQIVQEACRLYPLYEIVNRAATEDTEINGYHVPKNTVISMDILGIQKDPAYFDSPDRFMPERWTDELEYETKRQYTFAPFAVGPRRCPYHALAMGESTLLLGYLIQNFTFELPRGYELKTHSSINGFFPEDGVPVCIQRQGDRTL